MNGRPARGGLAYMPGLTGLRAFAVLAVIIYHSGLSWLPGGFYGVDTFFALSGFLITSLLVAEWHSSERISLSGFWARRARRLLPALFLLLAGIGIATAVWPSTLASAHERSDALATLFYYANWHFIAEHAHYFFATSQQSPLLHTWSLSIEEQFYIAWPLVVVGVLATGRSASTRDHGADRSRLRILLGFSLAGAVASAAAMALLYVPGGDPTRSYYGTDTRAQSLLVGASLALALNLWKPSISARSRRTLGFLGALGALATALVWTRIGSESTLAFRGGFLVAALASAALIACVALTPESAMARVLSLWPIEYLGRISYGLYLWYWPTLLVVDHRLTGLSGYPLLALRLASVTTLASLSYRFVETPIRRGSLSPRKALVAAPAGAVVALASIFAATAVTLPVGSQAARFGVPTGAGSTATIPTSSPTVTVLVIGDSMAGSLGVGLQEIQNLYRARVINEGSPGCSLGMDGDFKVLWYTASPGPPCVTGSPSDLLNTWRSWIDSLDPDVVVYMARGDILDQSLKGRWVSIGDPAYDSYLQSRLRSAIGVLSSRGAKVILATSPYYDSGESPGGSPWPEDRPDRVDRYNAILRSVASADPSIVSLVDSGKELSPGGAFSSTVEGATMRCTDGVHLTPQAGEWLGAALLTKARALGLSHASTHAPGVLHGYQSGPPSWYSKLNCP